MDGDIIHIGYHKTGTTWFQKNIYPYVMNKKYIQRDIVRKMFLEKSGLDFDARYVKNYFKNTYEENIIICEEELTGNIHTGGHHGFLTLGICHRLKNIFPEAKIVIFIRSQQSIIASTYKQYIKMGGNYSSKEYLFHKGTYPHRVPLFSFDHFNYYDLISEYSKLFGKENVFVYLFEEFLENKEKFINNYIKQLDLEINIDKIDFDTRNPGYNKLTHNLALLRNYFTNKDVLYKYYLFNIPELFHISFYLFNRMNKRFSMFPKVSTKDIFDDRILEYISEYYKKSNRLLEKEYELNLKKYNYPL